MAPLARPRFVMYFFVLIVFLGGLGWIEPIFRFVITGVPCGDDFSKACVTSLYGFFIAIAATAAVDFMLDNKVSKDLLMVFVAAGAATVVAAILASVLLEQERYFGAWSFAILGYCLSLSLWWIGNAENQKLVGPDADPTVTTGGPPGVNPKGDLNGFTN